jgi:benzoyl-CoA reductase/2-hydroxyglutaryl-CoA dehydratase subunit BcrC/BadD/HgdB
VWCYRRIKKLLDNINERLEARWEIGRDPRAVEITCGTGAHVDEAWNEAVEQVTAEKAQRVAEAYKGAAAVKKESVKSAFEVS